MHRLLLFVICLTALFVLGCDKQGATGLPTATSEVAPSPSAPEDEDTLLRVDEEPKSASFTDMMDAKGSTCVADIGCPGYLRCIERACTTPLAISGQHDEKTPIVSFVGESGDEIARFFVELATTHSERSRGLMFRRSMQPGWGMLFIYEDERPRSFWMKNTYIPLDMVFLDRRGEVVSVIEGADPLTLEPRRSEGAARYVLELQAGVASTEGIAPSVRMNLLRAPRDDFKPLP